MTVVNAPTSIGLLGVLGWQDELPPPPLIPVDTLRAVGGFVTMPQQKPSSQISLAYVTQTYTSYTMGPPQVSFLFQSTASH